VMVVTQERPWPLILYPRRYVISRNTDESVNFRVSGSGYQAVTLRLHIIREILMRV
jgi:hypothetical protein